VNELNHKLVADLALLGGRYPPEDWAYLIACLDDVTLREQVRNLLRELEATSHSVRYRTRPGTRAAVRTKRLREALERIRATDPVRADGLEQLWEKLRGRELLPTMPMVRAFAAAVGLKGLDSQKREQAVTELLERIVDMPPDELERLMSETVPEDRQLRNEYERWVYLIMGPSGAPQNPPSVIADDGEDTAAE
jgi:hypothetical protein